MPQPYACTYIAHTTPINEGAGGGMGECEPRIEDIVQCFEKRGMGVGGSVRLVRVGEGVMVGRRWVDLNQQPSQVKRTLKILYNYKRGRGQGGQGG